MSKPKLGRGQDWLEGQGRQGRQVNRAGKLTGQGRAEKKMNGDEVEWSQTGRGVDSPVTGIYNVDNGDGDGEQKGWGWGKRGVNLGQGTEIETDLNRERGCS
ncbi:hypothetical protein CGRA01v4_13319 [Colletotrichum graminicola]|nr:hypothetical protein CGRA01v4_13319 [Colletotrichum graminicola]